MISFMFILVVILDPGSDGCVLASFLLGSSTLGRNWDIKVTQYTCGDTEGGEDGLDH